MKIAVLTHTYPRFPGDTTGPFVEDLCEEHARQGHQIAVLTAFDPEISDQRPGKRVALHSYRYAWPDRFHVLAYSRTLDADVRMKPAALLLGPLLIASAFFQLLRLVGRMKPDVIHAHWIVPCGFAAALVSRVTGVPLFISLHGSDVFVAEGNPLYRWMARHAARRAAAITSCSPELRHRLQALGAPGDRIHIVPYGCHPAGFTADAVGGAEVREELGIATDQRMILSLGRFVHKKGFDVLLRAAASFLPAHPEARLVVAGGGELAPQLEELARELHLGDRVRFYGSVDRSRIAAFFASCDVFAMPSVRDASGNVDGLPVVILEAMSAAKPIVASDLSGIPLAVRHEQNGLLVPPGDPEALARAVGQLLDDPARAIRYGEEGRRLIERDLDWVKIAERHRELYRTRINLDRG